MNGMVPHACQRICTKIRPLDYVVASVTLVFSVWLMVSTLSYDTAKGSLVVASKLWSDFGAHIPLIRSFTYGINWPPQSPLFPGEPIRYHFLFDAVTGLLERSGVRIDWAINIPSIIGFFAMVMMLYIAGVRFFRNRSVGILAVIFALFNGSLSFLEFFRKHPLSFHSPVDILTNAAFPSFGPWDGKPVSAFWTLNIFTNQRHLAPSYAIILAIILLLDLAPAKSEIRFRIKQAALVASAVVFLFFFNQAAAAILIVWVGWIFLVSRKTRLSLIAAGIMSVPGFLLSRSLIAPSGNITYDPGYLMTHPLGFRVFVTYWFLNLGLHAVFLPVGIALAPKRARLFLAIPLIPLFIAPNVWRFSVDMINNHKFFNFFILISGLFTAQTIVWAWNSCAEVAPRILKGICMAVIRPVCILAVFLLTLSGCIDGMAIVNDYRIDLQDKKNPDIAAFLKLTPPGSVILNSTWFYHPASFAGRMIWYGYPYFTWSYGYDKDAREKVWREIYASENVEIACTYLAAEKIRYVELSDRPEDILLPNIDLWNNNFVRIYRNESTGLSIFDTKKTCDSQPWDKPQPPAAPRSSEKVEGYL